MEDQKYALVDDLLSREDLIRQLKRLDGVINRDWFVEFIRTFPCFFSMRNEERRENE